MGLLVEYAANPSPMVDSGSLSFLLCVASEDSSSDGVPVTQLLRLPFRKKSGPHGKLGEAEARDEEPLMAPSRAERGADGEPLCTLL